MKIGEEGFHSADYDVLMTARVFESMIGKVEKSQNYFFFAVEQKSEIKVCPIA